MLDLCKPIQGMPNWLVGLDLLVGVIGIAGIYLKQPLIYIPGMIFLTAFLFYGFYRQAIKLIRGESMETWFFAKRIHLDERQARNDLLAVDISWVLILYVIMFAWCLGVEGIVPFMLWPVLVLGIIFPIRFLLRWLLDRHA
jgi:hypothetical protein